jgi:hypothetical protein
MDFIWAALHQKIVHKFYPDYKLNRHSYIFRTKIINHYSGCVEFINNKSNLYQRN